MSQLALASNVSKSGDLFPIRPAFGTKGKEVIVWANYFQVTLKVKAIYKYTIVAKEIPTESNPKPRDQLKPRKLHEAIKAALAILRGNQPQLRVATEFKSNLFTMQKLNGNNEKVRVNLPRGPDSNDFDVVEISFEALTEVPVDKLLSWLDSMQDTQNDGDGHVFPKHPDVVDALNGFIGNQARTSLDSVATFNNNFFPIDARSRIQELLCSDRPLVAARGYFSSARIGTGRLLLNVNVTHSVFKISGPLHEIFDRMHIRPAMRNDASVRRLRVVAKFLAKTRVKAKFQIKTGKTLDRFKTILAVVTRSEISRRARGDQAPRIEEGWEFPGPKHIQFWLKNDQGEGGRYITVYDHYKQKYNMNLGDHPVLNLGTMDKPSFFPAEVLTIEAGQKVQAKLTGDETTIMLDFACRTPYANALSISTDSRDILGLDDQALADFGIGVDKNLLAITARVLDVPMVSYASGGGGGGGTRTSDQVPQNASWNMRNVKVVRPGKPIRRWTWVNLIYRRNDRPVDSDVVKNFGTFMSKNMGINIAPEPIPLSAEALNLSPDDDDMNKSNLRLMFQEAKNKNMDHILLVLSQKDSGAVYSMVKTLGDCDFGIHTNCVVADNFRKGSPGYFANVGLKWNLKAGGINHKLKDETGVLKDGATMVVGYDVTHPTNMSKQKSDAAPSLVGLVASIDRSLGQWPSVSWAQASKQEMLDAKLTEAFASRIALWKKNNNGKTPKRIVIFRDGVSEGQYAQVLNLELPMIREACRTTCRASEQPAISIMVSVKRHQTRFYPTSTDEMSRSGNIKNGTVVDRGITQVRYWDFYLTAHDALQGTARPAHYTVLLDEVFRSRSKTEAANELEKLTHELCYLFGRATKAISICTPAYYADILCERARAHRHDLYDDSASVSTSTATGTDWQSTPDRVHPNLRDTMYYI
ncbi:QDE2-like protein [Stachybotrys elegans]|uniref:QDE2-like protein n=1 Tax=Stachybotrys elegans TaxID=80388 RepID=A0A8K0WP23_9HYPO|nr:QDE2-like protein [Stachybotrys elegans]